MICLKNSPARWSAEPTPDEPKVIGRFCCFAQAMNSGTVLIGLASGTNEGVQAMLVFMVLYMIDVTGFFACLTALSRSGKPMETIEDMAKRKEAELLEV